MSPQPTQVVPHLHDWTVGDEDRARDWRLVRDEDGALEAQRFGPGVYERVGDDEALSAALSEVLRLRGELARLGTVCFLDTFLEWTS